MEFNKQIRNGFLFTRLILIFIFLSSVNALIFAKQGDFTSSIGGTVDSVQGSKITILNGRITLDLTNTELIGFDPLSGQIDFSKQITLSDIVPGGLVSCFVPNDSKGIIPVEYTIYTPLLLDKSIKGRASGLIREIDQTTKSIKIDNRTFNISEKTRFVFIDGKGQSAGKQLSDLKVGNQVQVIFELFQKGEKIVHTLYSYDQNLDPKISESSCILEGMIEKVEDAVATIGNGFKLDLANSKIWVVGNIEQTLDTTIKDIHIGQAFKALVGDEVLLDETIPFNTQIIIVAKNRFFDEDQAFLLGKIKKIDLKNRTIKILGITVSVPVESSIKDYNKEPIKLENLKKGAKVYIHTTIDNNEITSSSVEISNR